MTVGVRPGLLSLSMFSPQIKQKRPTVGKKAKKGAVWKFTLDLTHPVEDGILDSANFVSLTELSKTRGEHVNHD